MPSAIVECVCMRVCVCWGVCHIASHHVTSLHMQVDVVYLVWHVQTIPSCLIACVRCLLISFYACVMLNQCLQTLFVLRKWFVSGPDQRYDRDGSGAAGICVCVCVWIDVWMDGWMDRGMVIQ